MSMLRPQGKLASGLLVGVTAGGVDGTDFDEEPHDDDEADPHQ